MKRTTLLPLVVLIATLPLTAAGGPPPALPQVFQGNASFMGSDAPANTVVTAWDNGSLVGKTKLEQTGQYQMVVGAANGDTLTFYLNGFEADQTATFQSKETTDLDLTVSAPGQAAPVKMRQAVRSASAGSTKTLDFSIPNREAVVESVSLSFDQDVSDLYLDLTLRSAESAVGGYGIVHGIFDISGVPDNTLSSATITFLIQKDKVTDPQNVVLLHGQDAWDELTTRYLGEEETINGIEYYKFEADTPHFSSFAAAEEEPDTDEPDVSIDSVPSEIKINDPGAYEASASDESGIKNATWSFGDDTTETVDAPYDTIYTYGSTGEYTVTFAATDNAGNTEEATKTVTVTKANQNQQTNNNQNNEQQDDQPQTFNGGGSDDTSDDSSEDTAEPGMSITCPDPQTVTGGDNTQVQVEMENTGETELQNIQLSVSGISPRWYRHQGGNTGLDPDGTGQQSLVISPPEDGSGNFTVKAFITSDQTSEQCSFDVTVQTADQTGADLVDEDSNETGTPGGNTANPAGQQSPTGFVGAVQDNALGGSVALILLALIAGIAVLHQKGHLDLEETSDDVSEFVNRFDLSRLDIRDRLKTTEASKPYAGSIDRIDGEKGLLDRIKNIPRNLFGDNIRQKSKEKMDVVMDEVK